jgi:hypothetical protein
MALTQPQAKVRHPMTDNMELVEIIRGVLEAEKPPHELAQDVLTAIEASGRRIVPVEPTEAMLEAGMAEEGTDLASEYRAMLSASPKVTP